ncbi:MAG: replication-associated recombination protein A [Gammaproteobacteria bacterium]|jgi:putative ATPase|nr:replication-associated recombination protein A [Gammaproteobacteria bacterium]MBT3860122.1 replication-associated recombination protein A [Gammaproteobacteria bacterium]MBT3987414.1 replication-associated recombination protein A [Gammaproteobacteria bacterium]MBT4255701.1 replication-associated recombination protein A [Gammaproteobacteria bacterium]MBT4581848.1 replication-associated recombination protein A [Gammaproteobacteria bacterium]
MTTSLFTEDTTDVPYQPLAARLRPRSVEEFAGQAHLLSPGKSIFEAIENKLPHSMILWGPPGVGKTTLAKIIAESCDCHFESISAVLAGVKEIRATIEQARYHQSNGSRKTILFVDEVHRFNKAQQDAFLPHIENGTVLFIGATTENPSFELNNALLSRARVYLLKSLTEDDLVGVIDKAVMDSERGLGDLDLQLSSEQKLVLARAGDGDARRTLNYLEVLSDMAELKDGRRVIADGHLAQVVEESYRRFDKGGDSFYEQISALHKSVRGSSVDGSLYWLCRMLDGGADPIYLARRISRMAIEDIGLADPRALQLSLSCWDTYTRLGSPEGDLALAQAVVYLASAPKSNALYKSFSAARQAVEEHGSLEVPLHLRNASTSLSKEMGYGEDYRYAHDEEDAFAAGENYLPESIQDEKFYYPQESGLEIRIKEKMEHFRQLNEQAENKRYK